MIKIGTELFRSKFARRLFVMFILSAVLPVFALAILSFNKVTDQLLEQNAKQLRQETKAIGMAIFERLTFLDAELKLIDTQMKLASNTFSYTIADILKERLNEKFSHLGWFTNNTYIPLLGVTDNKLVLQAINNLPITLNETMIVTLVDTRGQHRMFMIRPATLIENNNAFLIGELDAKYLWNVEVVGVQQNFCVLAQPGKVFFCSKPASEHFFTQVTGAVSHSSSGYFLWVYDNKDYFVSYWSIFLKSKFSINDWVVVLSASKEQALKPIANFQTTFVIIVIITVLTVIMLSIRQIRHILNPLKTLTQGVYNIGNIHFDKRVVINSNDEFEDLAKSFNDMSQKLAYQFQSLEIMAEIDRLIVSSLESKEIVQTVLTRIQGIIACDQIGIVMQNNAGDFKEMYIYRRDFGKYASKFAIDVLPQDILLLRDSRQGLIIDFPAIAPNFLTQLKELGAKAYLVLPLFFDNELSAIITFGYQQRPQNANRLLLEARNWADRVGVALSNAKWQKKLYYQANYDSLTGLPNRLALKDYLQRALVRAQRGQTMLGVLFVDLDRFKIINDLLGHTVADYYLKIISDRINKCVKTSDMIARLAGDEFTVVISDNMHGQNLNTRISMVADKLLKSVSKPLLVQGHELHTTVSIGISIYPTDASNIEDLMKNADSAMYHAKSNGGDNYQFYSQELHLAVRERLRVEHELRYALNNNELELYFQPQVDIHSEQLIGMEALLRWNHPEKGMIHPGVFIPIAEQSMLIIDIDLWVLDSVCAQVKAWKREGYTDLRVSLNVSARFFQKDCIVEHLVKTFNTFDINAENIELEITEGSLIEDINVALAILTDLNRLGIRVAIDDFGLGHSSLSYLKQFPIHTLKIDQSFIRNCDVDSVDLALVKTIISLAHDLKLNCLAEGVERASQLALLREHGCDAIQGYFFSCPLMVDEFTARYLTN